MTVEKRLSALRRAMEAAGMDGYFITCSDPHCGEYLPDAWKTVAWFSGFTGENATLVLTREETALWVDGRFFVQADKETAGTSIQVMKMGNPGVPTREDWLAARLKESQVCGFDGFSTPCSTARGFEKKGITLVSWDLAGPLWENRPPLPSTPAWLLSESVTGQSPAQRLALVREKLKEAGAQALVVGALDELAWLLNLRAADVACTPYAAAFGLVLPQSCLLFMEDSRLAPAARTQLEEAGVEFFPYLGLSSWLKKCTQPLSVLADPDTLNYDIVKVIQENPALTPVVKESPIPLLKAVKTETELESLRDCHIQDGVAMVQFWMDLEEKMASGQPLTEHDIDGMVAARRAARPGYLMDSFHTIAAYGPNGAMMHYQATAQDHSAIQPKGFLLVDCGGQYRNGTTDITRTYQMGPVSDQERDFYTWVLQSHIAMARAVFLDYCTGFALDTFARGPLWAHLINYRCGTGHGVAFVGSVHEGPQRLSPKNEVVFRPGMVVTDEPGVYETDWLGIRIENELVCVEKAVNQYGRFLGFEPLTCCPYDLGPMKTELLTREEKEWINQYHDWVRQTLAPYLNSREQEFLEKKTQPIQG